MGALDPIEMNYRTRHPAARDGSAAGQISLRRTAGNLTNGQFFFFVEMFLRFAMFAPLLSSTGSVEIDMLALQVFLHGTIVSQYDDQESGKEDHEEDHDLRSLADFHGAKSS